MLPKAESAKPKSILFWSIIDDNELWLYSTWNTLQLWLNIFNTNVYLGVQKVQDSASSSILVFYNCSLGELLNLLFAWKGAIWGHHQLLAKFSAKLQRLVEPDFYVSFKGVSEFSYFCMLSKELHLIWKDANFDLEAAERLFGELSSEAFHFPSDFFSETKVTTCHHYHSHQPVEATARSIEAMADLAERLLAQGCEESGMPSVKETKDEIHVDLDIFLHLNHLH